MCLSDAILTAYQRSNILAATAWIIHGGDRLYSHALANDLSKEDGEEDYWLEWCPFAAGRLYLDKHPDADKGLSAARWAFWKDRFKSLLGPYAAPLRSRDMAVAEDVLAAVTLAIQKMDQVGQDDLDAEENYACTLKDEVERGGVGCFRAVVGWERRAG